MRIQTVCLFGLMVGLGACGSDDTSSGGTGGAGGSVGGNAGSSQGGSGGIVNGGSGGIVNGGSGGTVNGGTGGTVNGGTGGTTGGSAGTTGGTTAGGTGGTTGGTTAGGTGGTTGGTTAGGASTGGASTGGAATGGASTGGAATGGASTGGASTGGAATGGASTGGAATGGASTGGTSGAGTGGTGGASPTCTPITLSAISPISGGILSAEVSPELGTSDVDFVQIEVWDPTTGNFDLSTETDYRTCDHCVLVVQDAAGTEVDYFQVSGQMKIDSSDVFGSTGIIAASTGSVSNLTLTEVTIASDGTSTPVSGGQCLTVASANWSYTCNDGGTAFGSPSQQACDDCQTAAFNGCVYLPGRRCANNPDCVALNDCRDACSTSSDPNCVSDCDAQYPQGVDDLYDVLYRTFGDGSTFPGACGTVCQ
ncbi:MAG: hypothetical protein KC766_34915 [Myxococcales bacterium]|nr:hypothetical protein [Myxococcales bacterium]